MKSPRCNCFTPPSQKTIVSKNTKLLFATSRMMWAETTLEWFLDWYWIGDPDILVNPLKQLGFHRVFSFFSAHCCLIEWFFRDLDKKPEILTLTNFWRPALWAGRNFPAIRHCSPDEALWAGLVQACLRLFCSTFSCRLKWHEVTKSRIIWGVAPKA